jgi:hypothetical protein
LCPFTVSHSFCLQSSGTWGIRLPTHSC